MEFEYRLPVNKKTSWVVQCYQIFYQDGGQRHFEV